MATTTVKSNRQSYYPPISPNPTAAQLALHMKDLYTAINNHDEAIERVNAKVGENTSAISASASTSTLVTKTIVTTQFSGLGSVNDQTGSTSYIVTTNDNGALLILNDAAPVAVSLNSALTTPYFLFSANFGAGLTTFTPTSGLINGAATYTLATGYFVEIIFDGVNWKTSATLVIPQNFPAVTNEFLTAYNSTTGIFSAAQPSFANLSGTLQAGQLLTGTSGSLGGSPMTAGQTITIAVTVTGATTAMVAVTSPVTYPGDSFCWDSYVSAANTVTVRLTATIAGTPVASLYNCRVLA